jgi:arylsulfatase
MRSHRPRPYASFTTEESTPGRYPLPHPGAGAPNVVVIVLDDLGFGQLGCFGSDIATPNIDRVAHEGLAYNRFHVTAICSPTRASLLTGRNHHAVGMGFLTDIPMAYPGYTARIPRSAAPLPRVLKDAGYNTMAVGKWHLVTGGERSHAGPFDRWPLGFGFERFYGFLQGDTNHWSPNLVRDNHYVDPPATPDEGYHLTEDLADTATRYVADQHHSAPDRPFFLYWALGAQHAPHHVAPEWIARYRGAFDEGWERWRDATFARQVALGIVPEGTVLPARPSWVQDWDALGADERRLFAAYHEVYAGFLTHTDAQIGRLLDFLDTTGLADDTVVVLFSDNGTSAEGGTLGTFNEHRFSLALPESVEHNLARVDELGGVRSYNHYPWGWAWAGNSPLRLWKRYTWLGGTRTPLVVRWPAGIAARGEVRDQVVHVIDLMPTLLEACGVEAPAVVDGVTQQPVDGASLVPTFADGDAPDPRDVQYFEMLGSRSIIHRRWKATTDHVSKGVADEERLLEGSRELATDRWSLFRMDDDFAEARDLAGEHPDVLARLQELWLVEAGRNQVFPIVDDLVLRAMSMMAPPNPPPARVVFRGDAGSPVPDDALPRLFGGFHLAADVDVPASGAAGILTALGDWNNGFAFYVQDGALVFTLNRAGDLCRVASPEPVPPGRHTVSCTYTIGADGPALTLSHDDRAVASEAMAVPVPMFWQHGGTALCIGHDRGLPVCDDYRVPFAFTGTVHQVTIDVGDERPPDRGLELRAALSAE